MNILKEIVIQVAGLLLFVLVYSLIMVMALLPLSLVCIYQTPYPLLIYVVMLVVSIVIDVCDRRR